VSVGSEVPSRCTVRPKRSQCSLSQTHAIVPIGGRVVGSAAPLEWRLTARSASPQPSHRILVHRSCAGDPVTEAYNRAWFQRTWLESVQPAVSWMDKNERIAQPTRRALVEHGPDRLEVVLVLGFLGLRHIEELDLWHDDRDAGTR